MTVSYGLLMNFPILWFIFLPNKSSYFNVAVNDKAFVKNFEVSPKISYTYIKAFVFKNTINEKYNYIYLTNIYFQNFHISKTFVSKMKRYIISSNHIRHKDVKYENPVINMNDYIVKFVTGQIYLSHSSSLRGKTYIFHFKVNARLTLNITFLIIDFLIENCECTKLVGTKTTNVKIVPRPRMDFIYINFAEYSYCKQY